MELWEKYMAADFEVQFETSLHLGEPVKLLPLDLYDKVLIAESAGKDSINCLFWALDQGIPPDKIELVHQSVDGREDTSRTLFDWPTVEEYLNAVGEFFGIKVSYQWRAYGIYGELMRKDSLTQDVYYVHEGKQIRLPTTKGKQSTRRKWPAATADLRTRYCSAVAKIDVFRRVLSHHPEYQGTKDKPIHILVLTGERREESFMRARYLNAELHAAHAPSRNRIVHAYRPVLEWSETQIWDGYEKRRFLPFIAYLLGYSRTSCFGCIFSHADHWAMMREIAPERFKEFVRLERELNFTIDPKMNLEDKAAKGSLKRLPKDVQLSKWVHKALHGTFRKEDLIMDQWSLPAGAFGGNAGGSF